MGKKLQKQIRRTQSRISQFDRMKKTDGYHKPGSMNAHKGSAIKASRG